MGIAGEPGVDVWQMKLFMKVHMFMGSNENKD